jgi:hypothetical protein
VEPLALEKAIHPPEMKQKHSRRGLHVVGSDEPLLLRMKMVGKGHKNSGTVFTFIFYHPV